MMEKLEKTEEKRSRLRKDSIQPEALELVPEVMARQYNIVPLTVKGNVLRVAMANPNDILAIEALQTRSHMRIVPEAASDDEVLEAIDRSYRSYDELEKQVCNISFPCETAEEEIVPDAVTDAPIVKALTLIIDELSRCTALFFNKPYGHSYIQCVHNIVPFFTI